MSDIPKHQIIDTSILDNDLTKKDWIIDYSMFALTMFVSILELRMIYILIFKWNY
jgi:hypothetical protein